MQDLKVTLVQCELAWEDPTANREQLQRQWQLLGLLLGLHHLLTRAPRSRRIPMRS